MSSQFLFIIYIFLILSQTVKYAGSFLVPGTKGLIKKRSLFTMHVVCHQDEYIFWISQHF